MRLICLSLKLFIIELPLKIFNKLTKIPYLILLKQFYKFIFSQRYRLKTEHFFNNCAHKIVRWFKTGT